VKTLAGPLLAVLAIAAYLVPLYLGRLPRSMWVTPWPQWIVLGLGVAVALVMALRRRRASGWIALGVTLLLGVGLVVLLPLGTRLPAAPGAVAVGSVPPDFTLPSTAGGEVTLSAQRGRKVVLVFHRGHW
jgi:hypothetical protein